MTTHYKTRALVFKKTDRNESDRIFSVFTDDFGRLDVFAKAIRKTVSKLRSGIDIFSFSDIEFIQGKNRKTLTDAAASERFKNIFQDPRRFDVARAIGEILNNLIRGEEKHQDVFDLLKEVLYKLDNQDMKNKKYVLVYYYFLWNALSLLGHRPEVQRCNTCRQKLDPGSVYFSDKVGGVICKECLGQDALAQKINSDIVKILRLIFNKDWQVLSKLKIENESEELFNKVSENYYSYILSSYSSVNN